MADKTIVGIDYALFYTKVPYIINTVFRNVQTKFHKNNRKKGWLGWEVLSNSKGISVHFKRNRFGEVNALFIGFSPHSQMNKAVHNANTCTIVQAAESVAKTLEQLGVRRTDLHLFGISSIEIGANITVDIDPIDILASAVLYDKYFFQAHGRHKYYHYACTPNPRNKYKKGKIYVKSAQVDNSTGLTYHELGYCKENTIRIEFKIERASKFDFFDFSNLESLFKPNASELLNSFFWREYDRIFFYCPKDIVKKKLSRTQLKHYYQWEVPGFWRNCDRRKLKREMAIYNNTVKRNDLKDHIRSLILEATVSRERVAFPTVSGGQKMSLFLPYGLRVYPGSYRRHSIPRDQFCNFCYYSVTR